MCYTHREALFKTKFGMYPCIKATVFKWKHQLGKFSTGAAASLMGCQCGVKVAGVPAPQDAVHVVNECAYLAEWRECLLNKLRNTLLQKGESVLDWDSWEVHKKFDFVLMPCVSKLFKAHVQLEMKRVMGEALARLFLLMGGVFGNNKSVDQMVVQPTAMVCVEDVDDSVFVDLV